MKIISDERKLRELVTNTLNNAINGGLGLVEMITDENTYFQQGPTKYAPKAKFSQQPVFIKPTHFNVKKKKRKKEQEECVMEIVCCHKYLLSGPFPKSLQTSDL